MFCPKCGKELKDGSKFCKYCGTKIKPKQTAVSNNNAVKTTDDNEKTKKIIIGILIAVIVILSIVFIGYSTNLFNGNNNGNGNILNQAPSSSAESAPQSSISLNSFPVSEAPALAQAIKNSGGNFPVQFGSLSLTKPQCLYILTKSIYEIGNGNPSATISVGNPSYAAHPSGSDRSQSIAQSNYIDMSRRFSAWIESHGSVPNYIGIYNSGVPDVSPSRMLDISVDILIQYKNTNSLPSSINI